MSSSDPPRKRQRTAPTTTTTPTTEVATPRYVTFTTVSDNGWPCTVRFDTHSTLRDGEILKMMDTLFVARRASPTSEDIPQLIHDVLVAITTIVLGDDDVRPISFPALRDTVLIKFPWWWTTTEWGSWNHYEGADIPVIDGRHYFYMKDARI